MYSSRMRTARSLPYGGGLPNRDPLDRDPPGQRPPLDRDPLPPGQRPPGTQTTPRTENTGQRLPRHVICGACWDRDSTREQND